MKFKDKIFPYPIIKNYNDDYIESVFNSKIEYKEKDNLLILDIDIEIKDDKLIKLFNENVISLLVHLEESRTMFRESYKFNKLSNTISVNKDFIKNKVEVIIFLVTNEKIENYTSKNLSEWYAGAKFDLTKHLVIGYGGSFEINITKEDDDIKSISSIFVVTPKDEIGKIFEIDYTDTVISINVNNEIYETYARLSMIYALNKSQDNKILLTIMVLPAFVEVLNMLKEGYKNYEDNLWFRSLIKAFKDKNIDLKKEFDNETFEGYKYAQIIFEDIINDSVERLDYLNNERN